MFPMRQESLILLAAFDATMGVHELAGIGLGGEQRELATKDGGRAKAGEAAGVFTGFAWFVEPHALHVFENEVEPFSISYGADY